MYIYIHKYNIFSPPAYVVEDSHYAPIELMDSYYKSWTGAPEYLPDPYAYAPHFETEYQGKKKT